MKSTDIINKNELPHEIGILPACYLNYIKQQKSALSGADFCCFMSTIRFVFPKEGKKSNMVLIEGNKNGKPGIIIESPLIAHNDSGDYSDEIKRIFNGG